MMLAERNWLIAIVLWHTEHITFAQANASETHMSLHRVSLELTEHGHVCYCIHCRD